MLCSPERFASTSCLAALAERRVDLFAVDEAHCVSEWGRDFRPDYLRLRGVIDRLGSPAVMGCTATATEAVGEEVIARLGLRDPHVLRAGFDRPNLSFDVIQVNGTGTKAREGALLSLALSDPVAGRRSSTAALVARSKRSPTSSDARACSPWATTRAWRRRSALRRTSVHDR